MRRVALLALAVAVAGCRRAPAPVDPGDTTSRPPCPSGPHLVIGVQSRSTETQQLVLRYAGPDLAECRGLIVSEHDYGTLTTVGGLPDGTDLVGFSGAYARSGALVRFDDGTEIGRVDDDMYYPISVAAIAFEDQPAIAVLWGSGDGVSDEGARLDVYAEDGLANLASWPTTYELIRIASAPSAQAGRIAGAIGGGLQEYRADAGSDGLATTGELQVAKPPSVGYVLSLDVFGQDVRAGSALGVLSWQVGSAPAFLGPVACSWPDRSADVLPSDSAEYVSAAVDVRSPDDSLVIVDGALEDGSDASTHLYVLRPHGECAHLVSYPSRYAAVALAWSGR